MCEASQSPEEKRIPWGDNREIVIQKVNNERLGLSIEEKEDNKKVEFIIVDKRGESEWSRLLGVAFVYVFVVVFLILLNHLVAPLFILGVSRLWWLLPTVILGIGFLVQFLDALYSSLREKCKKKQKPK